MTLKDADHKKLIENVRRLVAVDRRLPSTLKTAIELLITLCLLLIERLPKNSKNSNTPPSQDPNRQKKTRSKNLRPQGAQPGHIGQTLKQVDNPDHVKELKVDRSKLAKGNWREDGYVRRQVFEVITTREVTEYRAQVLTNEHGQKITAEFPDGVTHATQYGSSIKAHAVYLSQFQLIPYERVADHFADEMSVPMSVGTIFNCNKDAYERLEYFDQLLTLMLINAPVLNVDETSINIDAKRAWIHVASTPLYTRYFPHKKRGVEAMTEMGILDNSQGCFCHDHWKPYYSYGNNIHALCNAHHIRELTTAKEDDGQIWAGKMISLLKYLNKKVEKYGGCFIPLEIDKDRQLYRLILQNAALECPETIRPPGKKGRLAQSKSRNLLVRLRDYEDDTLRFMTRDDVPFTNNLAENDLRMIKVQQKVSGCFRSWNGAEIFCRIRSYLSTCRKNNIPPSEALNLLFNGKLPDFINS
jgi:transposase